MSHCRHPAHHINHSTSTITNLRFNLTNERENKQTRPCTGGCCAGGQNRATMGVPAARSATLPVARCLNPGCAAIEFSTWILGRLPSRSAGRSRGVWWSCAPIAAPSPRWWRACCCRHPHKLSATRGAAFESATNIRGRSGAPATITKRCRPAYAVRFAVTVTHDCCAPRCQCVVCHRTHSCHTIYPSASAAEHKAKLPPLEPCRVHLSEEEQLALALAWLRDQQQQQQQQSSHDSSSNISSSAVDATAVAGPLNVWRAYANSLPERCPAGWARSEEELAAAHDSQLAVHGLPLGWWAYFTEQA
jgi:hypothetical protein